MRNSAHTSTLSELSSSSFSLKLQLLSQRPFSLLSSFLCVMCPSFLLSFSPPFSFFLSPLPALSVLQLIIGQRTKYFTAEVKYLCVYTVSEEEHVAKVTLLIGVEQHTHMNTHTTHTGRVTLEEKSAVIFPVQH